MFPKLDPILHSELRLAIMSILADVDSAEFSYIKKQTGATSGNLSVQIDKLSVAGYILVEKEAFENYVTALKEYISTGK